MKRKVLILESFLLVCNDGEFITGMRRAMSGEIYGLDITGKPDISSIDEYSLIILYSESTPLYLYEIRQICNVPIIVIDQDSLAASQYLEQGADDFLVSPVDFKELLARCRAVLRRCVTASAALTDEIRMEGLIINKESYDMRVYGTLIPLTSREFEIMYLLASNPNRVLTRDEILDSAFGADYDGDLRCIDVHIKKIRDKVENPQNVWAIKTVRGVGYKFSV